MNKPSVFVGSSSEGMEFARAVRSHLQNDAEIRLWNDGLLRPGATFIDTLLNSLPRFDFAILVLTRDDLTTFSPCNNVIFALGLSWVVWADRAHLLFTRNPEKLNCRPISPGCRLHLSNGPGEKQPPERAVRGACDSIRDVIRNLGVRHENCQEIH
jgi:hypothetical protein